MGSEHNFFGVAACKSNTARFLQAYLHCWSSWHITIIIFMPGDQVSEFIIAGASLLCVQCKGKSRQAEQCLFLTLHAFWYIEC